MAEYRTMRVSFWDDPYIESLQPLDKLLYIYLFTNPHVNNLGILDISHRKIAFETGLDVQSVASGLSLMEKDKKVVTDGSLLFTVNFVKHQTNTSPKIILSLKRQFQTVESPKIKKELCKKYPQIFGKLDTVSIPSNTVSIPCQELERELEEEVEEESSLRSDSCAEVAEPPTAPEPVVLPKLVGTLPLAGGSDFEVRQDLVDELRPLFPAVDVLQALRSMKAWLLADPKRKKTSRGIRRFITGWLDREQNRGGNMQGARASPPQAVLTSRQQTTEMFKGMARALQQAEVGNGENHGGRCIEGALPAGNPLPRS